jgi:hypothetical protein
MTDERRRDTRLNLTLDARWEGQSGQHISRVGDISLGGCFIYAPGIVSLGELINVEIKMPSGDWLKLDGQVAFAQPHVGFSIRFSPLASEKKLLLLELLTS